MCIYTYIYKYIYIYVCIERQIHRQIDRKIDIANKHIHTNTYSWAISKTWPNSEANDSKKTATLSLMNKVTLKFSMLENLFDSKTTVLCTKIVLRKEL